MIGSIKHKGLKRLFEQGDVSGLNPQHAEKITLILTALNAAESIEAMNIPSFRLHPLSGNLKGFWSVTVRANWRIVSKFDDGEAFGVDLVDYH